MGRENKRGGSIKRGGRINFITTIKGETLIKVSRGEKSYEINRRASPAINRLGRETASADPTKKIFGF